MERKRLELLEQNSKIQADVRAVQAQLDAAARASRGGLTLTTHDVLPLVLPLVVGAGVWMNGEAIPAAIAAFVSWVIVSNVVPMLPNHVLREGRPPAGNLTGTRAWEAEMTVGLLDQVIDQRRAQLERGEGDTGRLQREIAFLEQQRTQQAAIAASGDSTPGQGSFGFEPYQGN